MAVRLDRWTVAVGILFVGGALLACKKKEEEAAPVVSAAPAPEPPKEEKKEEPEEDEDEVKRYDDEKKESGTVRVAVHNLKVFKEADTTTELLATLNRGTLVNRLARRGNFLLIEYPSGVGKLSPGWVQAVQVSKKVEKVDPDAVKNQADAGTIVKKPTVPDAGKVAPKTPDAGKPAPKTPDAGKPKPAPTVKRGGRLQLPKKNR